MLEIGAVQVFHDPLVAGTCDIEELSKTCEMVARAKTELWHRILTHCLPLHFPQADRFHRSSRGEWFPAFLEVFPSPHVISAMDKDALPQGLHRHRSPDGPHHSRRDQVRRTRRPLFEGVSPGGRTSLSKGRGGA